MLKGGETRIIRKRLKSRDAIIRAAGRVMVEKGMDASTMLEIAQAADVGAGTVYNYFRSKEDIIAAVLTAMMRELGERIEAVTTTFVDPAQAYAFGIRKVIETATSDERWKNLLSRSELIADAMFRQLGVFAIRDLELGLASGRFSVTDATLQWRLTTFAIIGFCLTVVSGAIEDDMIDEAIIQLLGMTGVDRTTAEELARRPCPPLPD